MREKNYSWEPLGFRIKRGVWVNLQGLAVAVERFRGLRVRGLGTIGFWVVGFTEFGCRS